MPIYEFKCEDCKKQFEEIVSSSDAVDSVRCKHCQSSNVRKTISTSSFRISSSSSGLGSAPSGCSSKSGFS